MNSDVQNTIGHNQQEEQIIIDLLQYMNINENNYLQFNKDLKLYLLLRTKIEGNTLPKKEFDTIENQHHMNTMRMNHLKEIIDILLGARITLNTINDKINDAGLSELKREIQSLEESYNQRKISNEKEKEKLDEKESKLPIITDIKKYVSDKRKEKLDQKLADLYASYMRKKDEYQKRLFQAITSIKATDRSRLVEVLAPINDKITSYASFVEYVQENIKDNNIHLFNNFNDIIMEQIKSKEKELSDFIIKTGPFERLYEEQKTLKTAPSKLINKSGLSLEEQTLYINIVNSYPEIENIDCEQLELLTKQNIQNSLRQVPKPKIKQRGAK